MEALEYQLSMVVISMKNLILLLYLFLYCISSNNSWGQLFLFSHQKGTIILGEAIIRGRQLFQIFLTESRAVNILFYYPIK